jgi:hypothetical protein
MKTEHPQKSFSVSKDRISQHLGKDMLKNDTDDELAFTSAPSPK